VLCTGIIVHLMTLCGHESRGSIPGRCKFPLFATMSQTDLGRTHWVPKAGISVIKWPEPETDHSPPPSADIKNESDLFFTRFVRFMAWCLGTGTVLSSPFLSPCVLLLTASWTTEVRFIVEEGLLSSSPSTDRLSNTPTFLPSVYRELRGV
jgi:hypothetical protein